jgi:hypothetical protein
MASQPGDTAAAGEWVWPDPSPAGDLTVMHAYRAKHEPAPAAAPRTRRRRAPRREMPDWDHEQLDDPWNQPPEC